MDERAHYRPEIDGLRAVAILMAVSYHVKIPGLSGGFVGIELFFVISGYLITRLLVDEINRSGSVDFLAFYARRIRRLFPAMLLVFAVILLLGFLILPPSGQRQAMAESAMAAASYVANIYFWRTQSSYFSAPADFVPFLHMWTLSAEEQFYLIWPLALVCTAVAARALNVRFAAMAWVLVAVTFAVSIAAYAYLINGSLGAAFYLTPTRMWEFALGAAICLMPKHWRLPRAVGEAMAIAGVAVICVAFTRLHLGFAYYLWTVPMAFASAVLLAAMTLSPGTTVARVLSLRPVVTLGKWSYSWYLWHWPLLALARSSSFGDANLPRDLAIAGLGLVLAAITYTFVENPIRYGKPWPFKGRWQTVATGATLSAAGVAVALAVFVQANAAAGRDPWISAIKAASVAIVRVPAGCALNIPFRGLPPLERCAIGLPGDPPRVLLWGDSHAQHFVETVRADSLQGQYGAVARIMNWCSPIKVELSGSPESRECAHFNAAVRRELPGLAQNGLRGIVLGSRRYDFPADYAGTEADFAVWRRQIRDVLTEARALGLRVLVIAPVPTWRHLVPDCLAYRGPKDCGANRDSIGIDRARLVSELTALVADFDNARLWDPADYFCDATRCEPMRAGTILYSDWSHLTIAASRDLATLASPYLRWLVSTPVASRSATP